MAGAIAWQSEWEGDRMKAAKEEAEEKQERKQAEPKGGRAINFSVALVRVCGCAAVSVGVPRPRIYALGSLSRDLYYLYQHIYTHK